MENAHGKRKLFSATNILIALLVVLYLLDCYIPLPNDYTGYTAWDSPSVLNYIMEVVEVF